MVRGKLKLLGITTLLLLFASSVSTAGKIPVFVSIAPQKYFVQQIGKDLVDVQVMVKPGADPHMYEPKPRQMVAIAKAKLYFAIGIEFEAANLDKIRSTNPKMRVVRTEHGIIKLATASHDLHDESEGEHHDEGGHQGQNGHVQGTVKHHPEKEHKAHHEHDGLDPHIWLAPALVKVQAGNILAALLTEDPGHRNQYEANFNAFVAQIERLDADLKKTFAGRQGLRFMVFHPSWGYFAHAYGLKQVPVEVEGKSPKPAQLRELITHARENGIKVIFVQPQFSTRSAKLIAGEIGGQVAFADPMAADWLANLREVADKFKAALR